MTKQGGDSWKQAAQGEKKLAEYWESQAAAEKERADKAEERESRLREAIEYEIELHKINGTHERERELIALLASLYPEEGEAK